ncbi:dienelactone hydrolase family protein [Acidithiobacillus ferrianus]|uniref:Dienelactone hydrolase family protein n=2 Tax=Acidithiobacillus ferrianus TaxID=2678518 RepID=A0A845ULX4_9PROT|nr:dienelactone hydrolase family protein [Acidithiobacillus ferrianus]NDU42628.1 dienelactone hydrolase family protein [Acidithiobacillus ferrianus]
MSIEESVLEYQDGDDTLLGYLVRPSFTSVVRPAVLVVPEWWGLNTYAKHRARQLAESGYVALAADMYGNGAVTENPEVAASRAQQFRTGAVARARIRAAFDALQAQPEVDRDRVGAVGFCFGGSVVLELARSGAPVRSVTCFHGSLSTPLPAQRGIITSSVLVLHGADDSFISNEEVIAFGEEMRAAKADWQLLSLGGAVHSFSNPEADQAGITGIAFHPASARRAWRIFESFLQETLACREGDA